MVWYVSDEDMDDVCIWREMIEVREGLATCDIVNIGDVDFIINYFCINLFTTIVGK